MRSAKDLRADALELIEIANKCKDIKHARQCLEVATELLTRVMLLGEAEADQTLTPTLH